MAREGRELSTRSVFLPLPSAFPRGQRLFSAVFGLCPESLLCSRCRGTLAWRIRVDRNVWWGNGILTAAGRLLVGSCLHNTHDCLFWKCCLAGRSALRDLVLYDALFPSDPRSLSFPSRQFYLCIDHFEEDSLENMRFRVTPWLILKPWVVWARVCPVDDTSVRSGTNLVSDWGSCAPPPAVLSKEKKRNALNCPGLAQAE